MKSEMPDLLALVGDTVLAVVLPAPVPPPVFTIGVKAFRSGLETLQQRRLKRLREILEKKVRNNNLELWKCKDLDNSVVANHIRITIQDALETDSIEKINFLSNVYIHGLRTSFTSEDKTFIFLDICRRLSHLHISLLRDLYLHKDIFTKMTKIQEIFDFLKSRNTSISEMDLFRYVFYDLNTLN